jgi:hypothetical protein
MSMFFLLYEDHGIYIFQTYIQKTNFEGLWGFNHAIFYLENYLHSPLMFAQKTIV